MINLSGKHLKSLLALIERCQLDIVDCVRALESFAASSSEHGFAAWFREVVVEPLKDHGYHADPT